jgi:hypothetical protein
MNLDSLHNHLFPETFNPGIRISIYQQKPAVMVVEDNKAYAEIEAVEDILLRHSFAASIASTSYYSVVSFKAIRCVVDITVPKAKLIGWL